MSADAAAMRSPLAPGPGFDWFYGCGQPARQLLPAGSATPVALRRTRSSEAPQAAPASSWPLSVRGILDTAELHLALGARGHLTANVERMAAGYRTLVRIWAEPHLRSSEPHEPCTGCGGRCTVQDCPYRRTFVQVISQVVAGFAPTTADGG